MKGGAALAAAASLAGAWGCTSLLGVDFDNAHPAGAGDDADVSDTFVGTSDQGQSAADAGDAACHTGRKDCNGQCVSATDPLNGCAASACTPCSIPHAAATCNMAGSCAVGTCDPGRADCNGSASDGCEIDTTSDHQHCGSCTVACNGTQVCSESDAGPICTTSCATGLTNCSSSCVDTTKDPAHCGSCTNSCPPVLFGVATCSNSKCGAQCDQGFNFCSGQCLPDSPSACGASCTVCKTDPHGTAGCTAGACSLTCDTGFNSCSPPVCTANSPTSCGPTCASCQVPGSGSAACENSTCSIACNAGFAVCGGNQCCAMGDGGTGPILTNGDFETDTLQAWTSSGDVAISNVTPHGGSFDAMLGLVTEPTSPTDSVLQQAVTIPATGTTTLSFWYNPACSDHPAYDWQFMQVQSTAGAVLLTPLPKNCYSSLTWTQVTADLTPLAGQNVLLVFLNHDDGTIFPTNTLIDDVTVTNQ